MIPDDTKNNSRNGKIPTITSTNLGSLNVCKVKFEICDSLNTE